MTNSATPAPTTNVYVGAANHASLPAKSTGVAYLWWLFLGAFGAHHFYLGKTGRGLLYLFTLGLLGVGCLVDLFTLPAQTRAVNAQRAVGIR
jgi:TM2 domain-containing membrane protein YozV